MLEVTNFSSGGEREFINMKNNVAIAKVSEEIFEEFSKVLNDNGFTISNISPFSDGIVYLKIHHPFFREVKSEEAIPEVEFSFRKDRNGKVKMDWKYVESNNVVMTKVFEGLFEFSEEPPNDLIPALAAVMEFSPCSDHWVNPFTNKCKTCKKGE